MAYGSLFGAIIFEIIGAYCMKRSRFFSNASATLGAYAASALCITFTIVALKKLSLAYAWAACKPSSPAPSVGL